MTLYQKIDNPDGSFLFKPASDLPPQPPPPFSLPARSQGIDVSKYQGVIEWPTVKASGKVAFVFVRASIGTTADPMFAANWSGARIAGLPRGAYHYYWTGIDPKQQADFFLSQLGNDLGELPLVIDCEFVQSTAITKGADLRTFCEYLTGKVGRKPLIYTGSWWWSAASHLTQPNPWAAAYGLWLAAYVKESDLAQYMPADWKAAGQSWAFWQYGKGAANSIPGITAEVDLDMSA